MKSITTYAFLALSGLSLLIGCGASERDATEATASAQQGIIAAQGEACGGFAGILCEDRFECVFSHQNERIPDAQGVCEWARVGEGESCGGWFNRQCKDGLECQVVGNLPDIRNVCVQIAPRADQ